jgi:hypothetical protein
MIDILHRFLLQNRSISIPGLGTLHAERIPAQLSKDASQINPPGYSFRFDKYFDAPDKAFFVYLSGKQGVPEYESMRIYNQFAQDFRSAIMLEERAEWPGIGYFRKNLSGEVEFVQTRPVDTGYAPVNVLPAQSTIELTGTKSAQKEIIIVTPAPQAKFEAEPVHHILQEDDSVATIPAAGIEEDTERTSVAGINSVVVEHVPATESETETILVSADKSAPASTEISHGEQLSSEPDSLDYPSPLEEEISAASHTNRVIMRIGWGIAAAASLLMILHFSQHGFTMKAAANNQTFHPARP